MLRSRRNCFEFAEIALNSPELPRVRRNCFQFMIVTLLEVIKAELSNSSATSAVTYTSVYTDSFLSRQRFLGSDMMRRYWWEAFHGSLLWIDRLPYSQSSPPSQISYQAHEDPLTTPVLKDEDEREPYVLTGTMFLDYIPRRISGCTRDDVTEDGMVDYPLDWGDDDGVEEDGDSLGEYVGSEKGVYCLAYLEVAHEGLDWDLLARQFQRIAPTTWGGGQIRVVELTQHQVHETRFQMQQAELAALRETDRRRQDQMVETLRVIRDMRREMSDMQADELALERSGGGIDSRGQWSVVVVGFYWWIEKIRCAALTVEMGSDKFLSQDGICHELGVIKKKPDVWMRLLLANDLMDRNLHYGKGKAKILDKRRADAFI
ncbi:hypothetical protein Tco_0825250 [Tanacetum coccineum]